MTAPVHQSLLVLATLAALEAGPWPSTSCPVDDIRYELFELVARADLLVSGEIAELRKKTFDLAVEQTVLGGAVPDKLSVCRFEDWTCAGRWTSYAIGQRVLLFLAHGDSENDPYTILGAGGEGEMPLIGDAVIVRGYDVRGYKSAEHAVAGGTCVGPLVPCTELAEAVRTFTAAFSWRHGPDGQLEWLDFGSEPEALLLSESSRTGKHLWEQVVSSRRWRHPPPALGFPANARRLEATPLGLGGAVRFAPGRKPDSFGFELDSWFGHSCAYIGDVDGNGVGDLAVGAPKDSFLGHFHGALWIFLMGGEDALIRTVEISEVTGNSPMLDDFGHLGFSVAPLGDLDGDGVPDIAVGAPGWNGAAKDSGGVWVHFLNRAGSSARTVELGGQQAMRAAGVGESFGLGSSMADLGDLDGDGLPELAIGQDPAFDIAYHDGCSVLIVSLSKEGTVRKVRKLLHRDVGLESGFRFGAALLGLGDLNGDGVPDMAVGDSRDSDGGSRGAVWTVILGPDGSPRRAQKISAWEGGPEGVLREGEGFGGSLASPGDLDGDHVPDLVVGGEEGIWVVFLTPDGGVKRHARAAVGPQETSGFRRVGISASCDRGAVDPAGTVRLAVGGKVGRTISAEDGALWLLRLGRDGALSSQ